MLKHTFVSAKTDGPDTTKLRPSNWNAEHTFDGGALGSLIYRDTGASDGASWLAAVAVGQVLVSGGVGAAPAWSATPTLTSLTVTGLLTGANLTLATSATIAFGATGALVNVGDGQFLFRNNVGTQVLEFAHDHLYFSHAAGGNAITANGAGIFLISNEAQTIGFTLNGGVADVCKIRNRANSGYATMDALGYSVSGVAGASGTFGSVTVVNGIVTAGT